MAAKFIVVLSLVCAASALPVVQYEAEAPAHYEFSYSVEDAHTGDVKQQQEARAGDAVQGSYSLLQPDGVRRIVHYTADKEHGFNAEVAYEGHPTEATKVAYAAAPLTKVAYAAPKISYAAPRIAYTAAPSYTYAAAPVANYAYAAPRLAYSAPVSKLAYAAQPLAHVTFSSPAISYQH